MNYIASEVHEKHHIRKTNAQKQAFLAWATSELENEGYQTKIETAQTLFWKSNNLVVGDPDTAELVLTAHYDTPPVMPFPNIITPKNVLIYWLYQIFIVIILLTLANAAGFLLSFVVGGRLAFFATEMFLFGLLYMLMCGPANKNNANDNTSGVSTLLHTACTLPAELRPRVAFVFFDNEEKSLLGSGAFAKMHPKVKEETLLINFDCVGEGDHILIIPPKALMGDEQMQTAFENAFLPTEKKNVEVCTKSVFYPSDQKHFKKGVAIAAFLRGPRVGLYLDKIHTAKDINYDHANIELLSAGISRLLSGGGFQQIAGAGPQ
ncbi:M28 family metallopeptidase [Ruminococcaceae bacterium OttesenSCG-928-N02]|nr:M28 family metallopeptidase [Ruminococcaceae bacterium OttesenSCG-928-N02]